jgi:aspartyl-tRNA(Asn)/glutamyl-tRNA(Gln) amidotransferase subunit A
MPTILGLGEDLREGRTSSSALVEAALEKTELGEGPSTFTVVYAESARAQADAIDRLRASGVDLSPLAGLPISIKDLFDVAGETTRAGSRVLAEAPPAEHDARIVALLRSAGAVIIGKTNMTEFAFGAVGVNETFGTPRNPYDRSTGRVPGGSSSGAAISVTDGMAVAAVGTDTGGSIRIPSALCGLTGFKPTAARVSTEGAFPLSTTLDSVGPLAHSVTCCALLDAALGDRPYHVPQPLAIDRMRFLVPENFVLEGLDEHVAHAFERALERITMAGARIDRKPLTALDRVPTLLVNGGFAGAESAWTHRPLVASYRELYDPRILTRILAGGDAHASDYLDLLAGRREFQRAYAAELDGYDAALWPTVPIVAPPIAAVAVQADYMRVNDQLLRNPRIVNLLDGCALSLPVGEPGSPPVGLMVAGEWNTDERLLRIGRTLEDWI